MTDSTISEWEQPPDALHATNVEIEVLPGPSTSSTTTTPSAKKGYKRKMGDPKDGLSSTVEVMVDFLKAEGLIRLTWLLEDL